MADSATPKTTVPTEIRRCPPGPRGVHVYEEGGLRLTVWSPIATRVEVCIYDDAGEAEIARFDLPDCTDGYWHGWLPEGAPGLVYGYRVHGTFDPAQGLLADPAKLLLDPYARALATPLKWHKDFNEFGADTAPFAPKARVTEEDAFDWQGDKPPRTAWEHTVIMETHVKGFTQQHPDIPEDIRGTYEGLAHPAAVQHFKDLGVTAVELLPVTAFAPEGRLTTLGLKNYWGYNPLAFFVPEPTYGTAEQLKKAVRAMHAAGLEVILDVVYNHTAEGDDNGPTVSWRGLDNTGYYRHATDDASVAINDTGCGNTIACDRPRVIQMITDALRYWITEFHVDGFRFDLGVVLGRDAQGFRTEAPLFIAMLQDPVISTVKLIMEPWDIGPGGYQIGRFPPGFAEWNGRSRDSMRRYWKGDAGRRTEIAGVLQGSANDYDHSRRLPWSSINFVTAHDGFTLADLVSYNERHNEANHEDNRDGESHNESNNWGVEGETDDAAILETRGRVQRSLMATQIFAHGTPMILMGDDFGQTQGGNNNAYCQDSPISWLDWKRAGGTTGEIMQAFTARALELRREHPGLRSLVFCHGDPVGETGLPDTAWFGTDGDELSSEAWENQDDRAFCLRRVARARDVEPGEEETFEALYLLFNASDDDREFLLKDLPKGATRLLDSTLAGHGAYPVTGSYVLKAHGLALLQAAL